MPDAVNPDREFAQHVGSSLFIRLLDCLPEQRFEFCLTLLEKLQQQSGRKLAAVVQFFDKSLQRIDRRLQGIGSRTGTTLRQCDREHIKRISQPLPVDYFGLTELVAPLAQS